MDRNFRRMAQRARKRLESVDKKVQEILEDPRRFKPLRAPMHDMRRVHIGPLVLVYRIDEGRKVVILLDFEHHDAVYRR